MPMSSEIVIWEVAADEKSRGLGLWATKVRTSALNVFINLDWLFIVFYILLIFLTVLSFFGSLHYFFNKKFVRSIYSFRSVFNVKIFFSNPDTCFVLCSTL